LPQKTLDLDGASNQNEAFISPVYGTARQECRAETGFHQQRGGGANVKRIVKVAGAIIGLVAISLPLESAAVQAADSSSSPVIIFNDSARQAELIIPTPACPASQPNCQWKFFLNEPKLSVDVATVYGTSGTLTIDYPSDFCGVIQADAYVGPPWVAKRGFQHTIEDCAPPTSPTAVPPDAPATNAPTPPATSATTVPAPELGSVSAASASPPVAPQVASASSAPAAPPAAAPSQLPFTGANIRPVLFSGLTLVVLGLYLLTSSVSRRRMARRVGNCPWPTTRRPRRSS
jgi:hypothetical protein